MVDDRAHTYTMGDNEVAGSRLALLHEVFEPTSTALLHAVVSTPPRVAVDLGCGPGHTTSLLARRCSAVRTVGLDASGPFVERARLAYGSAVEFSVHDVTKTPFPTPPADLLFARFLLAHLPTPVAVVEAWCSQLSPRGLLATDETERIDTDEHTFVLYERIAGSMIAHYGANLYVGTVTRDLSPPPGCRVVHSQLVEVTPATATVARLFAMNLETWRHDPFIVQTVDRGVIDDLADGLRDLERSSAVDQLCFCNRQVVYERAVRG